MTPARRILWGVAALAVAGGLAVLWQHLAEVEALLSPDWLHTIPQRFGASGPGVLVGLMVLAIVVSPIPSGPIAVAAGMIYGTLWGGVLSILGSGAGAVLAFCAARYLGYDAIRTSKSPILRYIAQPRSEWALMAIVLASRLVPFISFDAVSYAAGLTCLSLWRFAVATFLGIVPICFALAAVGAGMIGGTDEAMPIVVLAGGVTLLPFVARGVWALLHRRDGPPPAAAERERQEF